MIEGEGLFDAHYPNTILVPISAARELVIAELSVALEPTPQNGCSKPCWAVSHPAATTSKVPITATPSHVTAPQLSAIRRQVALTIGLNIGATPVPR